MTQITSSLPRAGLAAVCALLFISFASAESTAKEGEAVLQLERDLAKAWLDKDAKAVDALEAKEYVFTDENGRVTDQATDVKSLKDGTAWFDTFALDDMKSMVFGDTVVVIGRNTLKGTYLGQSMAGVYRFTDTWIKRDGHWQLVASQATRIAKP